MTQEEAQSLSGARTFNRSEEFAGGCAAVLTCITASVGGLWEEEVVCYDLTEARRMIAASEAAIAAGLKSRNRRMRLCATCLDAKLDEFLAWRTTTPPNALAA